MILAVDLGSTSLKAGLFDADLEQIGLGSHALTYNRPRPEHVEIETAEVAKGLRKCISEALSALPQGESVKAVAITSQAQTFSFAERDEEPKAPFISWLDGRAAKTCEEMRRLPFAEDFSDRCSFPILVPYLQICILKNVLAKKETIVSEDTLVLPLPSYLMWLLSGEYLLDTNLAAMSGLYSLKEKVWWQDALDVCGVSVEQMPRLCETGTVAAGTISKASGLGLGEDIPIVLAGNDQTAGAYGARIHDRNALLVTLGTAYAVYGTCGRMPDLTEETTARGRYPGGRYYMLACDTGGAELKEAVNDLAGADHYDDFFRMLSQTVQDPGGRKKAEKARMVVDGLIARIKSLYKAVSSQVSFDEVLAAGGGSKEPRFLKMIAEAVGKSVKRVNADPLLGAARMAKEAIG